MASAKKGIQEENHDQDSLDGGAGGRRPRLPCPRLQPREFFTPDVVWHGGALGTVTGVDTIVPVLGGFIGALTGIKAEVQDVIANKDLVALRLVVSATHTGNLLGIPATGRRVQWDAVDIYRVRDDGKISEQWAFEDMAAILSQLGAAKLPWAG